MNPLDEYKPNPIGIMPKWIWMEQRKSELRDAIMRYANVGLPINKEWLEEYFELEDQLKSIQK